MTYQLLIGDCLDTLKTLPEQSVHTCVTSPPYFGLRDYGVEGQIGLEQRAPEYIVNLVSAFSEVYRVLRNDGTLMVNIGDTFAGYKDGRFPPQSTSNGNQRTMPISGAPHRNRHLLQIDGYKDKELMGIPWRFAIAMQDGGWYLRQEIIWSKPNYTPEKVRDRCVRSHEKIFLFTKRPRYYFDGEAIKVPSDSGGEMKLRPDVWRIPVSSWRSAHFATFPPDLILPCILAGCPEGGTVLDPFGGSGTTAGVALAHGRNAVLGELSPEYAALVPERIDWITDYYKVPRVTHPQAAIENVEAELELDELI